MVIELVQWADHLGKSSMLRRQGMGVRTLNWKLLDHSQTTKLIFGFRARYSFLYCTDSPKARFDFLNNKIRFTKGIQSPRHPNASWESVLGMFFLVVLLMRMSRPCFSHGSNWCKKTMNYHTYIYIYIWFGISMFKSGWQQYFEFIPICKKKLSKDLIRQTQNQSQASERHKLKG